MPEQTDFVLLVAALICAVLSFAETKWPLIQIAVILIIISLLI